MQSKNENYDAVVIGTGQGGGPLAGSLANSGWKTAIIEQKYVGGSCINYGCTPTKTMVASARIAYLARRASDYGINIPSVSVNLSKVRERKQSIVESFRSGSRSRLESKENLTLLFGKARFTGSREVEVVQKDGQPIRFTAKKIFINTGAKPVVPDIPGLADTDFLDSTSIMELTDIPDHLMVMGGGYVGLEFAQMFRRFGSRVTVIQRNEQLLPREDADVAEAVADILREDGIEIYLNSEAVSVNQSAADDIRLLVRSPNGEKPLQGSHLLVAVGRRPNTDELELTKTGIETDQRGYIPVNERLETAAEGIYALGDVKPGPAFTHISYDDSRILQANLLKGGHATISNRLVPYTVFIDPQLGRVGFTEKQARKQGINYRVAKIPMEYVARAIETGETRGFMKALVDAGNNKIIGCAILGIEGGELMSALQVAMMGGVPFTRIRDGVFAHPTLSESLNNLFATIE